MGCCAGFSDRPEKPPPPPPPARKLGIMNLPMPPVSEDVDMDLDDTDGDVHDDRDMAPNDGRSFLRTSQPKKEAEHQANSERLKK